jgi:hypothetical protein
MTYRYAEPASKWIGRAGMMAMLRLSAFIMVNMNQVLGLTLLVDQKVESGDYHSLHSKNVLFNLY